MFRCGVATAFYLPGHICKNCRVGRCGPGGIVFVAACKFARGLPEPTELSLARWGLGLFDYESPPYTTYYPAVLFATVVGGTGTGAFAATVGGAIGWWAFTPPHFALLPMRFGQEVRLVTYLFVAFLFVFGVDHYRRLAKRRQDVAKRLQDEDACVSWLLRSLGIV
jgi:hypothetical protein